MTEKKPKNLTSTTNELNIKGWLHDELMAGKYPNYTEGFLNDLLETGKFPSAINDYKEEIDSNPKIKHITFNVKRNFEYPLQTEIDINSAVPIELTKELKSFMDDTENRLNKLADRLMENEIFKETCAKRSLKD